MEYITKCLIGVAALSFLLADGLASWTLIFSGEAFSLIFNNLMHDLNSWGEMLVRGRMEKINDKYAVIDPPSETRGGKISGAVVP